MFDQTLKLCQLQIVISGYCRRVETIYTLVWLIVIHDNIVDSPSQSTTLQHVLQIGENRCF